MAVAILLVRGVTRQPAAASSHPTVTRVEFRSTPEEGSTYHHGEHIDVAVYFSESVEVDGQIYVSLRIGEDNQSNWRGALYNRTGPDSRRLIFRYTVKSSDLDQDGISVGQSPQDGSDPDPDATSAFSGTGTIRRLGGDQAEAEDRHPRITEDSDHRVNGRPRIEEVRISSEPESSDGYEPGEEIRIEVDYDQPVQAEGRVNFVMHFGDDAIDSDGGLVWKAARAVEDEPNETLEFVYTVKLGDVDADGIKYQGGTGNSGITGSGSVFAEDGETTHIVSYPLGYWQEQRVNAQVTPSFSTFSMLARYNDYESLWLNGPRRYIIATEYSGDTPSLVEWGGGDHQPGTEHLIDFTAEESIEGIWSDGSILWVLNADSTNIRAYELTDGIRKESRDIVIDSSAGSGCDESGVFGLWSDGSTLWIGDYDENSEVARLCAYDLTSGDGNHDKTITLDTTDDTGDDSDVNYSAQFVDFWSDGETVWVLHPGDEDSILLAYSLSNGDRVAVKDVDLSLASGLRHISRRLQLTSLTGANSEFHLTMSAGSSGLNSDAVNWFIAGISVEPRSDHRGDPVVRSTPFASSALVTSEPADEDTYQSGEVLTIELTFNEPVIGVSDESFSLVSLDNDDADILELTWVSGSFTNKMVYGYTVADGDYLSSDDDFVIQADTGLAISQYGRLDSRAIDLSVDLPHSIDDRVKIDDVQFVTTPRRETGYRTGETVEVSVNFRTDVQVDADGDAPEISLNIDDGSGGDLKMWLSYDSGSGTDTLVFSANVLAGQFSWDGAAISEITPDNDGADSITSTDDNLVAFEYPEQSSDASQKIYGGLDAESVTVTSTPNNGVSYQVGETFTFTITYSSDIGIEMFPSIKLMIGETEGLAAPISNHRVSELNFLHMEYTIVAGDEDADGIEILDTAYRSDDGSFDNGYIFAQGSTYNYAPFWEFVNPTPGPLSAHKVNYVETNDEVAGAGLPWN